MVLFSDTGRDGSPPLINRRITFAYVMNKMAPGGGAHFTEALAERVKNIVTR